MPEQKKEIQIELLPDVAAGHYSNFAVVVHTALEFSIDFIQNMPGMPKASVRARIIMVPGQVKALAEMFNINIARYEEKFGEIKMPKQPEINYTVSEAEKKHPN